MNQAQIHLMLNHIPVIGSFLLALFFIHFHLRQRDRGKKSIFIAYLLILPVIITIVVTGDPSEEILKNYQGINSSIIDLHENFAYASLYLIIAISLLSFYGLYFLKKIKTLPSWFNIVFISAGFILMLLITLTARYGGEIRHPEIL